MLERLLSLMRFTRDRQPVVFWIFSVLLAIITVFATACTKQVIIPSIPVDYQEAEKQMEQGKFSISGQAFLRQKNGGVVYAGGERVLLLPATKYLIEYRKLNPIRDIENTKAFSGFLKYGKETVADGIGKFEFEKLKPGNYYLQTKVNWEVWSSFSKSMYTTGGFVNSIVNIDGSRGAPLVILTW